MMGATINSQNDKVYSSAGVSVRVSMDLSRSLRPQGGPGGSYNPTGFYATPPNMYTAKR